MEGRTVSPQAATRATGRSAGRSSRRPQLLRGRRPGRNWGARAALPLAWLRVCLLAVALGGAPAPAQAAPRTYTIDVHTSSVMVLLYRQGLFALLAHDHVIVAEGFAGRVTADPADLAHTALQLTFPVPSLQVDPLAVRQELGLAGKLSLDDRKEIQANMLAPAQLDGVQYPRIVATLESVSGQLPDVMLTVRVRIKKTEKVLSIPAHVELAGDEVRATGEFTLLQSDFGVEPYSAVLGAIAVQDPARVRFRIVARAEAG